MASYCNTCHRHFKTREAYQQHLRDSPVHTTTYDCQICERAFVSSEALQQHLRDRPVHRDSHTASITANNSVSGNDTTPLDRFFLSFPAFAYDPRLPPSKSYMLLQQQNGWRRGDSEGHEAWDEYQNALKDEFQLWYGAEDDLNAWHSLCRAIRINPLPSTCRQCEWAVRNRHVNLIDLIEFGRHPSKHAEIKIFSSVKELSKYSRDTNKIFRNTLDEDSEEGGVVLRHLLRRFN